MKNLNKNYNDNIENNSELTEEDFSPPEDNRLYWSCVDDITGGDNFEDYVYFFWAAYENEIYDL